MRWQVHVPEQRKEKRERERMEKEGGMKQEEEEEESKKDRKKNGPFYGHAGGSMQHSVFKSDFYCF